MTGPITYGELIDDAAAALAGLHTLTETGFWDWADAEDTSAAWRRLLATGIRHANLLAPNDHRVTALPRLRPARRPALAGRGPLHPAGRALVRSTEWLGLAHDVLASHLGPERQHRTQDAALIERAGETSPAMSTLSSLLLTAAVAHQVLATRVMELEPAASRMPAPVARILREGIAVLGPAARLHDLGRGPADGDVLRPLTPATPLIVTEGGSDPAGQLAGALSRLQVAAHRQGRGELAAGAATMRAFTAVATTLIRRDLDRSRFARRAPADRAALVAAGRSWASLHAAWSEVRTLDEGSRGARYDAVTALRLLGVRGDERPDPRRGGTDIWLSTVAGSLTAATGRLAREGSILVPTRWCEGADIPRAWTAAWPEHLDRLIDLHQATRDDSARLARRLDWSPARGATAEVRSSAPALARTS